ncbi:MAG TPA: four helix bundle protein [Planctomycetota bacterium]|nr:four helix bundle protein [Planctomycetota bacterium]
MSGETHGSWMSPRRNANRGYRKLVVWQDAVDYYVLTCRIFRAFPFGLRRVASNQIASVDSVHRNIAEGYCRRTASDYLRFLNVALSSLGESVSGLHAYRKARQVTEADFEEADGLSYKLENGLTRLTERVASTRSQGQWDESFIVQESNAAYGEGTDG